MVLDISFIETLPAFAERVCKLPPPKILVNDLAFEDTITMAHGQPRDGKSLAELEIALAASTGTCAFGLERFFVPEAIPVCYLTEEDSERWVWQRLQALKAGRCTADFPSNFHLAVRRGIDIDDTEWQRRLIAAAKHYGFKFMTFDPLRAFTKGSDQGPIELKPVVQFVRRFVSETKCAVRFVHHDTKQLAKGQDSRSPAQRASGGGIYSIADCPLSFQRKDKTQTLVTPNGYKFMEDPSPFVIHLVKNINGSITLRGDSVESDNWDSEERQRLLEAIKTDPG